MTANPLFPTNGLQLQSTIHRDGRLDLRLVDVPSPAPKDDEVVVRIEATPINPSDLGLLFGPADLSSLRISGSADRPVVTAEVPSAALPGLAARLDRPMPVGNEGAGTVVAAGASAAAQGLLGRRVALLGGAMYAQFRTVAVAQTLRLPDGASAVDGASSFVNPLTALGMIETMRHEGHRALVHTAAASNLGQMLNRLCRAEGIGLVNVVRKPAQVDVLRALGAEHVCDSSAPDFDAALTEAVAATGATLAFDAIGGGPLAGRILAAMEAALNRGVTEYSRYGSTTMKQVYLYGSLDPRPTEIVRTFGMTWGIGGWLVFGFLGKLDAGIVERLKGRVAAELTTTFASRYDREVSLAGALSAESIAAYSRRATGVKYLIRPDLSN